MSNIDQRIGDYEAYLTLKNFSKQTRSAYLRALFRFDDFRRENKMGGRYSEEQAKQFLLSRIREGKSWSTINLDYSALRKYFREVAHLSWRVKKIPRTRKDRVLPHVLSNEDVIKIIEHAVCNKHQIFLTFVYATGLRLSEALPITFDDIDGNRQQIRVCKGKGHKDRYVAVPGCLIDLLRRYYRKCRPEKYLFNGRIRGELFSPSAAQRSLRLAKKKANVTKPATIHTLRHCYATHHIESGTDLVFIQEQLGHKHLRTTARYVHLCLEGVKHINHPISSMQISYL